MGHIWICLIGFAPKFQCVFATPKIKYICSEKRVYSLEIKYFFMKKSFIFVASRDLAPPNIHKKFTYSIFDQEYREKLSLLDILLHLTVQNFVKFIKTIVGKIIRSKKW